MFKLFSVHILGGEGEGKTTVVVTVCRDLY